MPTPPDYVTGAEMSRYFIEESAFRERLELRMAETARALGVGLTKIETHLAVLNGSTMTNTSGIGAIEKRLIRIEREYEDLAEMLQSVKSHGCAKYEAHSQVLSDLSVAAWSPKKKAAVGGGMIATGALIWPVVQEGLKAVHALIERFGR